MGMNFIPYDIISLLLTIANSLVHCRDSTRRNKNLKNNFKFFLSGIRTQENTKDTTMIKSHKVIIFNTYTLYAPYFR